MDDLHGRNAFLTGAQDIFLANSAEVEESCLTLRRVETAQGSRPSIVSIHWRPAQGGVAPNCDLAFNPISDRRWQRGDSIDLTLHVTPVQPVLARCVLDIRLPFLARALGDQRFGTVFALSATLDRPEVVAGAEMCVLDGSRIEQAWPFKAGRVMHLARAKRVMRDMADPALVLRLHLNAFEGEFTLRLARVFVGQDYDPFLFNPFLERRAARASQIDLGQEAEAKAEFLRQAEQAMLSHEYRGQQCFLKPFIFSRGGRPTFPLLIGTANSLNWYAQTDTHNSHLYTDDGYVTAGGRVLDCGAHAGELATLFALGCGDRGRVMAFDPFPQNHLQVEAQAILNRTPWLESQCAGVGSGHAVIPTELELQQTFGPKTVDASRSSFPLKIVPLDDYTDFAPTFIKIDIEGAEAACLQGAQKLLMRHKPRIYIEVHPRFLPDFKHTVQDVLDLIPRSLYRVSFIVPGGPATWTECDDTTASLFEGKEGGYVRADPR